MKNKTEELKQKFEILKSYYNSNQFELALEKTKLLMKEFPNVPVLYNFFVENDEIFLKLKDF